MEKFEIGTRVSYTTPSGAVLPGTVIGTHQGLNWGLRFIVNLDPPLATGRKYKNFTTITVPGSDLKLA